MDISVHFTSRPREPDAAPRTLAGVLQQLEADPDIPEWQRADCMSAIRTVCRACGRPPSDLPSAPQLLRPHLDQITPVNLGIGDSSCVNVISRLRRALRLAGIEVLPGRYTNPLSPEWSVLFALLSSTAQVALSRFVHVCSAHGIRPTEVTRATFAWFHDLLERHDLASRWRSTARNTQKYWNEAANAIEAWPKVFVAVPDYRDRYALPWDSFQPELVASIEKKLAQAFGEDMLSGSGRRPIERSSAEWYRSHLHRYLSALVLRGHDPKALRRLADLVEIETVKDGMRFFLERAGDATTKHIYNIMVVLCTVARHWVKVRKSHQQQLEALRKQLDPGNRHVMTEKNRKMLLRFRDRERQRAILTLARRVITALAERPEITISDAVAAQVAFAIALLIVAPVRISNLASVEIGRQLMRMGGTDGPQWTLHFPADEVKNDMDMAFPIPAPVAALLELYLERFRPLLTRQRSDWLFPGEAAGHKQSALFSRQIAEMVTREVGIRVTAHQFRHLAAFFYLLRNPGGYEVVRRFLGHKDIATMVAYYAPLESDAAIDIYQQEIAGLEEHLEQPVASLPRRS